MIDRFETIARALPTKEFCAFVNEVGEEFSLTYRQARLLSAAIALRLRHRGLGRGSWIAFDLSNTPEYILMTLAAGYGSFSVVLLDTALSRSEKQARLKTLAREGIDVCCVIDEGRARALIGWAGKLLEEGFESAEAIDDGFQTSLDPVPQTEARQSSRYSGGLRAHRADAPEPTSLGRHRAIFSVQQDALDDVVHWAEQIHRFYDDTAPAFLLFSTTGASTAQPMILRWSQLVHSAQAAARLLGETTSSLTLVTLPLSSIQGLCALIRAIVVGHGLRVYRRFDAARLLWDSVIFKATHTEVTALMLKQLLAADDKGALRALDCILIDVQALKPTLAERAMDARLALMCGFGYPESSGLIAVSALRPDSNGGLQLLEGVDARILHSDASGFGTLALAGSAVFRGYLSGRSPFTVDGYFLTGDRAALVDGLLWVHDQVRDLFRCGGEMVSREEIERTLVHVPGVWDAHVMDVEDAALGRRPVALIERALGVGSELTVNHLRPLLTQCFSAATMPKHLCFLETLPVDSQGFVDTRQVNVLYRHRIEVKSVRILRFESGRIQVEVEDHDGRCGRGEAIVSDLNPVVFAEKQASREVPLDIQSLARQRQSEAVSALGSWLAPLLVHEAYLHPREIAATLMTTAAGATYREAASALEMACWGLFASIEQKSLRQLLEEEYRRLVASLANPATAAQPVAMVEISVSACGGIEPTLACIASAQKAGQAVHLKHSNRGDLLSSVESALSALIA